MSQSAGERYVTTRGFIVSTLRSRAAVFSFVMTKRIIGAVLGVLLAASTALVAQGFNTVPGYGGTTQATGHGSGNEGNDNVGQLAAYAATGTTAGNANSIRGSFTSTGSLTLSPIGTPSAPSIVGGFSSGTTDYYFCVAEDSDGLGYDTPPSTGTGTAGRTGTMSCGGQTRSLKYYLLRTTSSTVPVNRSASLLVGSCKTKSGDSCTIADANNSLTYFSPTEYDQTGMPPLADRDYLISFQPTDTDGGRNTSVRFFAPRGVQNGDCLVAIVTTTASPTTQPTTSSGFRKIGSGELYNTYASASWWKKTASNEAGSYTFSWRGNAYVEGGLFDFRGLSCTADTSATNYGNSGGLATTAILSANGAGGRGNIDWRVPEIFLGSANGDNGATALWTSTDNYWREISTNTRSFWVGMAPWTKFQLQYGQPQVVFFSATPQHFAWGVISIY